MEISFQQVGKKYTSGWVIKNLTHTFQSSKITGISGQNGAGKSTLLQLASSILTPTEGSISFKMENKELKREHVPFLISHIAPSIDFIDSMTVEELVSFHIKFRPLISTITINELYKIIWLENAKNQAINELSSGMKQRLKLGLAFFTTSSLLLLDEPTSNLDQKGIELYENLMTNFQVGRTVIIASNEKRDFINCETILDVNQWKTHQ